ncbi:MAG: hydroxymethylbilane synthase [Myxococcota bacterium]
MRLGTRKSELAMAQSGMVARSIGPDVKLVGVTTEGDRLVDVPLRGALQKGFFTHALEAGLVDGELDFAVHSLKDLPVEDRPGLTLGAIPERESPADVLIVRHEVVDEAAPGLPVREGATIGAASERRQSLARTLRPDVKPEFLRGNVPTRVRRLAERKYDAILLAEAGLRRLGVDLSAFRAYRLAPMHWPGAPGQGALALQCRAGDEAVLARLRVVHDEATARAVVTERRWLQVLGGGCAVPFGAVITREGWAIGVDREGTFRIRRGTDVGEGDAALRELLAGGASEGWPERIWEAM